MVVLMGNVDISSLGGGGATTSITAGTNVTIDGDGTGGNPYVINALIGDATDGVITNVELNGTDLEFTGSPNGGFTGTIALGGLGGGGSTELADQVTIIGDGSTGNEFRIRPSDFKWTILKNRPYYRRCCLGRLTRRAQVVTLYLQITVRSSVMVKEPH